MQRSLWVVVSGCLVLLALSIGAGRIVGSSSHHAAVVGTHGLARLGSSASEGSTPGAVPDTGLTFGPNVKQGIFAGVSPAVSTLPVVLPAKGTITPRDNETLHPQAAPTNVTDSVVKTTTGTQPISTPLANFDGICLPFGPPCAQASGCQCLPPDTNGEAGATQYVEIVNTNFAVYSKTGAVLRRSTPINLLWK